jgi:RPA family protein
MLTKKQAKNIAKELVLSTLEVTFQRLYEMNEDDNEYSEEEEELIAEYIRKYNNTIRNHIQ